MQTPLLLQEGEQHIMLRAGHLRTRAFLAVLCWSQPMSFSAYHYQPLPGNAPGVYDIFRYCSVCGRWSSSFAHLCHHQREEGQS